MVLQGKRLEVFNVVNIRLWSAGTWCHVLWYTRTNTSEQPIHLTGTWCRAIRQ